MSPSITPSSLSQLPFSRRGFLGLGAGLGAAVGLSACAVDPQQTGQGTPEGSVRFAWWGNDSRQRIFTEFAEGFPGGTVRAEPSEYSGYVDRLNVQAAGSNLPDVFWIPANLAQTYASRGALLDLDSVADGVDYSAYDPQVVESWKLDGGQYAPVYSQYSVCAQLDTTALNAAGITDLPDDESWTWDDLSTLAAAYAQARGEGNWGIANQASFYQHAHLWIRQQGGEVFTADGQVGFDADVLGTWFDFWRRATDAGGVMPTEVSAGQTQWTQTAGRTAMYLVQLNQVQDNVAFSEGSELALVKSPAPADTSGDYQFQYYTRLCTAGSTGDPELAAAFIDYSLNDPSNAEVVGLASGIPSNPDVVALIREQGDPTATKILDITERIDPDAGRARPEPPVGGADWQRAVETAADNIFNAGADIASESQQAVASIQAALGRG